MELASSNNSRNLKRARHQINDGPEQVSDYPQDIVTEIFSRLPVKSLMRFKSGSKSWFSLISSKRFIKKHLDHSTKNTGYTNHCLIATFMKPNEGLKQYSLSSFLNEPSSDAVNVSYPPVSSDPYDTVHVVGCHNGLCCLVKRNTCCFILWNPFTREFKKLPDIDRIIGLRVSYVTKYGFGYDEGTGDYKVLGMVSSFDEQGIYEPITKIYSLKTNSWKTIEHYERGTQCDGRGLFLNNRLHWDVLRLMSGLTIFSFDIGSEVKEEMELPNYVAVGCYHFLRVLGGCLSLISNYFAANMEIWVMKQYGVYDSWFKLAIIPQLDISLMSPVFLTSEGEILFLCGTTFRVYDPKRKVSKKSQPTHLYQFMDAFVCVQSLVSLSQYHDNEPEK